MGSENKNAFPGIGFPKFSLARADDIRVWCFPIYMRMPAMTSTGLPQADTHETVIAFEALLDDSAESLERAVELNSLKKLCARGIPPHLLHLRPLAYDVLLGLLSPNKEAWPAERAQMRDRYYGIVESTLGKIDSHTAEQDDLLEAISRDVKELEVKYRFLKTKHHVDPTSRLRPPKSSDDSASGALPRRRALQTRLESIAETRHRAKYEDVTKESTETDDATLPPDQKPREQQPLSTPQLSLTVPDSEGDSSITLLSPKDLTASTAVPSVHPGSVYKGDTAGDAVVRLVYLAVYTHKWLYASSMTHVATAIFRIYLGGTDCEGFAEEHAFWTMGAIRNLHQNSVVNDVVFKLRSVDQHLYSLLDDSKALEQFEPAIAGWLPSLWTDTFSLSRVVSLWDILIASSYPAKDAEICVSLVLAVGRTLFDPPSRSKGLWGEPNHTTDAVQQASKLLQAYPPNLLELAQEIAFSLEQRRLLDQLGSSDAPWMKLPSISTRTLSNWWTRSTVQTLPAALEPAQHIGASLQERLSKLTFTTPSTPRATGPKPLLLSEKAKRASNAPDPSLRRASISSTPPSMPTTPPDAALSPPSETPGLYRIGSRNRSPRTSPNDHTSEQLMVGLCIASRSIMFPRSMPRVLAAIPRYARPLHDGRNYADHRPLSPLQNAVLAVGSGTMGVLDTSRGDLVATLSESTAATFLPSLHHALVRHPEGRQIMRDKPIVSSETVDLTALRKLQRGTLGREYAEWLHQHNLSPDSREKVRYIDSPTLAYTMLRYRQTHDLYHTLFSLPPTLPHELTLKVVELSNMSLPVAAMSSTFGPLRLSPARRAVWLRDWVPWALRTGRAGRPLVGIYWEKRWEQGLGDLRRELAVSRNDTPGVESRWRGYRDVREMERRLRSRGDWIDEEP